MVFVTPPKPFALHIQPFATNSEPRNSSPCQLVNLLTRQLSVHTFAQIKEQDKDAAMVKKR